MPASKIIQGDCLEVLKTLEDNSVDAVVTDPPYGLSFMGKKWDYDVPSIEVWQECWRVLKPGGHLLAFAGTRTQHRMAVRIEDAGFEIRDMIAWVYGSGFPKSLDVSKTIDKKNGKSLAWFIDYVDDICKQKNIPKSKITQLFPSKNGKMTGWFWNKKYSNQDITVEQFNKIKEFLGLPFPDLKHAEREIIGKKISGLTNGNIANFSGEKEFNITPPATESARQWEGWGTALKPAIEPITVARKPFATTVAENVMEWGTGGLNIDGCRVKFQNEADKAESVIKNQHKDFNSNNGIRVPTKGIYHGDNRPPENYNPTSGRFPANFIHDGSDEVVGLFPANAEGKNNFKRSAASIYGGKTDNYFYNGDSKSSYGSAARFFYCAKASKAERDAGCEGMEKKSSSELTGRKEGSKGLAGSIEHGNSTNPYSNGGGVLPRGNHHPTVKPIALMRYLCRLVTPPNGIVLDPFAGSGTTGIAAHLEGFDFIGIEREAEYCQIDEARIKHYTNQLKIF